MSISHFPPKPESMAAAQKFIDAKRKDINESRTKRSIQWGGMMEAISGTMGSLGVSAIDMGGKHIDLVPKKGRNINAESQWETAINEGKFVAAIQAGNLFSGYAGREKVMMENRTLDELVDLEKIHELAPDAVIYGPGERSPWTDIFHIHAFSIWVADRGQFDRLWAGAKEWMKTAWHDETLKDNKYPFKAKDVFSFNVIHDIAPDLSFRHAQYLRAQAQYEQENERSQWDALSQQEVKKIIGSLIQLEGHPMIGSLIPAWLEQLKPVLAYAMEGKGRGKLLEAAERKTRSDCYTGFKSLAQDWGKWTPQAPLPYVVDDQNTATGQPDGNKAKRKKTP